MSQRDHSSETAASGWGSGYHLAQISSRSYVCCSVLQCVAVCCSVLQCVARVSPSSSFSKKPSNCLGRFVASAAEHVLFLMKSPTRMKYFTNETNHRARKLLPPFRRVCYAGSFATVSNR